MGETMKTVLTVGGITFALDLTEKLFGPGVAFTVALAGLCLCVGVLYGAGSQIKKDAPTPTKGDG